MEKTNKNNFVDITGFEMELHISPLDNNKEADIVNNLLRKDLKTISVEKPTSETNALIVPIFSKVKSLESWELREKMIDASITLLKKIRCETIRAIETFGVSVRLRIYTYDDYLPIKYELLEECARLKIDLCVTNMEALKD